MGAVHPRRSGSMFFLTEILRYYWMVCCRCQEQADYSTLAKKCYREHHLYFSVCTLHFGLYELDRISFE